MTPVSQIRRWAGRAVSLRVADVRAVLWTARAVRRLRPILAAEGTRARVPGAPPAIPAFAIRSVAFYLRIRRASCFERTLTLQRFLAAHGQFVTIAIGVATADGFRAHAWLVDVDPASESNGYVEIRRIEPEPGEVGASRRDRAIANERTSVPWIIIRQLRGAAFDATARRALMLTLPLAAGRRSKAFQPYNDTRDDRYPDSFSIVASDRRDLTVVSFGCSVGNELLTLRRYFPRARLIGIDALGANVADARRLIAGAGLRDVDVREATDLTCLADESVDLIFAMAVFRHGALARTRPPSCRPFLRFDAFDAAIADLTRCLRPGGTLVVEHSNFQVGDTTSARVLVAVSSRPDTAADTETPCYGPDDRLLPFPREREIAFRKAGSAN